MVGAARPPSEATESAGCGRSQISPRLHSMPQPSLAACASRFYQRPPPLSIWHRYRRLHPRSSHQTPLLYFAVGLASGQVQVCVVPDDLLGS